MTSPFCELASRYDALWDRTSTGRQQREEVWRTLDGLFWPGERVLDLGCGTGTDALRLMNAGIEVVGIDASVEMVSIAELRGVRAKVLPIERVGELPGRFDGAFSNFGALNCVTDLKGVSRRLGTLVRPSGYFAVCFISRVYWGETFRALMRGDLRKAFRRWSGKATWRGITVWYPTQTAVAWAFRDEFDLLGSVRIGGGDHTLYVFRRKQPC